MKRKDIPIIILTLLMSALAYFVAWGGSADNVKVLSDGNLIGEYPLNEDRIVDINGTNILVIKDGKAFMEEADCPDKLCIKQGEIDKKGGSIICLPNKIVIETKGSADAVSR